MTGEFLIGLASREEFLFPRFTQDTNDVGDLALLLEMTFDPEARRPFLDVLLVAAGEIAFGETKVIDSVKQVSLPHAIVATETHNPFRKPEGCLAVVLELKERYIFYRKQCTIRLQDNSESFIRMHPGRMFCRSDRAELIPQLDRKQIGDLIPAVLIRVGLVEYRAPWTKFSAE